nr:hypothetical protein [Tanacetum cinerariifolium]
MTVHAQPVMSHSHSARVTKAMALSDSTFCKRYISSYETPSSSSSPALPVRKRYQGHGLDDESHGLDDEGHSLDDEGHSAKSDGLGLEGEEEAVPEGQQWAALVMEKTMGEPLGLDYGSLRQQELAVEEDHVYNTFEVGHSSGSVPGPKTPKRVSALRQPESFFLMKNPPLKHLVFEESELDKQELGKLEVGKPGVDKQEREENQEVEFDLTSSEDNSWRKELVDEFRNKIIPSENRSRGFFLQPNSGCTLKRNWKKHKLNRRIRNVWELQGRSDLVEISNVSMRVFFAMIKKLLILNK